MEVKITAEYKKQKLVYFIASTYINSVEEATVTALCLSENGWEQYFSTNLLDEHIQYYETEEDAKKVYAHWANTDITIHGRWIDAE